MVEVRTWVADSAAKSECGPPTPSAPSVQLLAGGRFRGHFVNRRGKVIHTVTWHPKGNAAATSNAAVLFLHGYGACVSSNPIWSHVAQGLTAQGLICMGFDYEGHGRSGG